jgi:LysM repeat protein
MQFGNRIVFSVCALALGLALAGCEPPGRSDADDTKEPHFVLGQSRVNAMDYQGAIEAFEESLEANPRSAQAHYQLAMLYEQHVPDAAAAIYHYGQYLKFDPKAPNADIVNQRIGTCKQQLAADVMAMPTAPAAMRQIEQLTEANQRLQMDVAYYSNQLAAAKINPPARQNNFSPPPNANPIPSPPVQNISTGPKLRTHTVVAGETAAGIARKAGVKLSALQAANPGVNLSRINVNQVLNLPSP